MKRTHKMARVLAAAGAAAMMGSFAATAEASSSPAQGFVITAIGCQTSRTKVEDLAQARSRCFPGSQSIVQVAVGGANSLGRIILNLHLTMPSSPFGTGAMWSGCRRVAGTKSSTVWSCPNGPGGKNNPAAIVDSALKRSNNSFSMRTVIPIGRPHKRSKAASVSLTGHLVPTGSSATTQATGVVTFSYPGAPVLRWRFTTLAPAGA